MFKQIVNKVQSSVSPLRSFSTFRHKAREKINHIRQFPLLFVAEGFASGLMAGFVSSSAYCAGSVASGQPICPLGIGSTYLVGTVTGMTAGFAATMPIAYPKTSLCLTAMGIVSYVTAKNRKNHDEPEAPSTPSFRR